MQRSAKFDGLANDFVFLERDHWRTDLDVGLMTRSHMNQLLKHPVILRTAIRIAGTVFGNGADINSVSPDGFSPAHSHGKKMRVAKRHVGYGNFTAVFRPGGQVVFRYRDAGVG